MKTIVTLVICLLGAVTLSHAAPDAARVAGDLRVDGIVFNKDNSSMQTKASPWSFITPGTDIFYNPAIPGNVGIGNAAPTAKLDVSGTILGTSTTGNGIQGVSYSGNGSGVFGYSLSNVGVSGESDSGTGVYGQSITGYAGLFNGNVFVSGTLGAIAFQGDGSALTNVARFKSTSFPSVAIPTNGAKITFATHTFTPQQSGTVIARARGFCNLQSSTSPELVIIFIDENANALSGNTENIGVASAPVLNPVQGTTASWTAENTFNVSSGVPITLYLAGSKPTNSASGHHCSGTFTVEFYNGSL